MNCVARVSTFFGPWAHPDGMGKKSITAAAGVVLESVINEDLEP
jgi:hypothetical protein